jgi:hypothetical protein
MAKPHQFQPGNAGGPGRPRGSRNALTSRFLADLLDHYEKNGKEAIDELYRANLPAYIRVVADLIPKQQEVEHTRGINDFDKETLLATLEDYQRELERRATLQIELKATEHG